MHETYEDASVGFISSRNVGLQRVMRKMDMYVEPPLNTTG
jgi:hypothetical protein